MSSRPAQALTIFPQSGPSKDYVRVDDDRRTAWCLAKTTFGRGVPHEPCPNSPKLTPAELAKLLAPSLD
jgi:hypothetical protein